MTKVALSDTDGLPSALTLGTAPAAEITDHLKSNKSRRWPLNDISYAGSQAKSTNCFDCDNRTYPVFEQPRQLQNNKPMAKNGAKSGAKIEKANHARHDWGTDKKSAQMALKKSHTATQVFTR